MTNMLYFYFSHESANKKEIEKNLCGSSGS